MAKKKVPNSNQEKPLPNQEDLVKSHQQVSAAMDSEASEKFENLKSLNQMLLKEAFERRQQVESLLQAKGSLESELSRSVSEREVLRSELSGLSEEAARFELERIVVAVFVAVQVGQKGEVVEGQMRRLESEMKELETVIDEKKGEIVSLKGKLSESEGSLELEKEVSRKVCDERDQMKVKFDLEVEEGKGLRANLTQLEGRKKEMELEMEELRVEYDVVVGERKERERRIELIMVEKDLIESNLVESNKLMEEIKKELHGVIREKEGIQEEKNAEMVKRRELEDTVSRLNEMVLSLQEEEEALLENMAQLEKKWDEEQEKQKEMSRKIDKLVEEGQLSEKRVERLIDEKNMIEKDFCEAVKQLDDKRRIIEEMVNEKMDVLEAKGKLDSEVDTLKNQVVELKAIVLELEESSAVRVEKINSLESEIGDNRCTLEQIEVERDVINNCWHEEKQNALELMEKIEELKNKVEESIRAAGDAKAENAAICAEKIELESQCEMLKKEIIYLENSLSETRNEFDSMKGKVELADANSELVLKLLKETAAFCSKDERDAGNGDLLGDRQINGEETKSYVMELEMIKSAFKSKQTKVENMKRQLNVLQNSVAEARKKKSFWTLLSSATTVLAAAASIAYVARGR